MIRDLKKNIETEFDILREIANLTNQVEISSENERRLLFRAIDSLRRSLKIVNNSIPNLIESLDETGREGKRETIVELERVEFKGEHTKISITVPKGDRDSLLKELSINEELIKKLKKGKKYKIEKIEEIKASRGYLKLANRFFLGRAGKQVDLGKFKKLSMEINKANLNILLESYVAMIYLTTCIVFIISFVVASLLTFFQFNFSWPVITAYTGNYLIRALQMILIPIIAPAVTFLILYVYPSAEKGVIGKKIDQELPFAVIHMSAIAGSGIEPSEIFKIIGLSKEYPSLGKEIRKVMNQINLYGYDLVSALINISKATSSQKLAELLSGLATTVSSGGSLPNFFDKRSESLLLNYRLEREKYTKSAETFMDIYISVVIAAPTVLLLLLIMISISGIQIGFSTSQMTLLIIL